MKFDESKLRDKLENIEKAGWLKNFCEEKEVFIKKIKDLEYTSPREEDVFNAFTLFKPEKTKILIIGRDPYPSKKDNEGRAHGLAFSFGPNAKKVEADDSILNIFKAIQKYNNSKKDIKYWNTNLKIWAKKNKVLLLNTALTYECENQKNKHQKAWEPFIKNIIANLLTCNGEKLAVFLWGDDARKLFHEIIYYDGKVKSKTKNLIEKIERNLLVLTTSHPTKNHKAYKKGFCYEAPNHFKACDEFLFGKDKAKYVWKNFPKNNPKISKV